MATKKVAYDDMPPISMFGDNVVYEDEQAEKDWESLQPTLKKFLIEQGAIPLNSEDMFVSPVSMLSTAGQSSKQDERNLYEKYGLPEALIGKDATEGTYGSMRYSNNAATKFGTDVAGMPIEEVRTVLAITDRGEQTEDAITTVNDSPKSRYRLSSQASPEIEEYLHYVDSAMGDISTDKDTQENRESISASEIMFDIIENITEQGWDGNEEELLNEWMLHPDTAHLDLNNLENRGMRTLLKNRSHHGGVVDVREGMGKYLIHALTDEGFKDWATTFNSGKQAEYFNDPRETFAAFARPDIKFSVEDAKLSNWTAADNTAYGFDAASSARPYNLPPEMSKNLADILSTFLNAEALERKGQTK